VARIFISHSSANNDWAIQLRDWLIANGWDDVFLDLDPERGIAAGERWKEEHRKPSCNIGVGKHL
jgi:TIR domain